MSSGYAIGIDLGGTNIKGAVLAPDQSLVLQRSIATEADQGRDHVIERMQQLVQVLIDESELGRERFAGAGVGAPGPLSHARGVIYAAPNLPGFVNVPLRDELQRRTGLPISLENDANAAAFGEFTSGAGADVQSMVLLTLGTGVGGGIVLNGQLWRGAYDNAGEIGHTIVVPRGRACPCGQSGCLERYASANAVGERFCEAIREGAASSWAERVREGAAPGAPEVDAAARDGDPLATKIWNDAVFYLALTCVNLQHAFNPERIVLSGGLIHAGDRLLEPLRAQFHEQRWRLAEDHPEIVFATLGYDAGVVGAAALAWREAL